MQENLMNITSDTLNEESTFAPILKLQNDYNSENLSNILMEKIFGKDTDMVFHFAEGSLRCHKLVLCPKSPLLCNLTSNLPQGSELHFSCPDVRLSIFHHIIELIYLGMTKITDSEIEELKSVAKIFMISFGQSKIVKFKLGNSNSRNEFVSRNPDAESKAAGGVNTKESMTDQHIKEKGCGKDGVSLPRLQQDISILNANGQKRTRNTNFNVDADFNLVQKRTKNDQVKSHICSLCAIRFDSVRALKRHDDSSHMKNGKFFCPRCDYTTPVKDRLCVHHFHHAEQGPNLCKVRGKRFLQSASLIDQMKKHSGNNGDSVCFLCNATFDSKKLLKLHRVSAHQKDGVYFCSKCGIKVDGLQKLHVHFESHNDEFSYQCSVCPKKFRRDVLLRNHMRTHIEKELYHCEDCGKEVSSSECVICNDCFLLNSKVKDPSESKEATTTRKVRPEIGKSKSNLISKSSPYVCHICGCEFLNKTLFKIHVEDHDDEL